MKRDGLRLSRAGVLAVAITIAVAGVGTAAYSLAGRRLPAAAHTPPEPAPPAAVTLRARLSAAAVTYGTRVKVTGTVKDAAGAPLAGQTVQVVSAPVDDRAVLTVLATRTSDQSGRVRTSFAPRTGSDVWLVFAGTDRLAAAASEPVGVAVAPRIRVSASSVHGRSGWTTALRGTVAPATAGGRVLLDRQVGTAWRSVAAGTMDAAGRYTFTVRSRQPGRFTYRVSTPAAAPLSAGAALRDIRLVAPPAPRVPPGSRGGGPGRLLVTGDSFAFFLGQQLSAERKPLVTTVESKHSSGLSRPDFFDWSAYARKQVAARPGGVVAFLGANDCQPIRLGGNGRWVSTGGDEWLAEYRRRAAELMRIYSGGGARPVIWVGLPIVAKPDIAACYRAINAATAAAARDAGGVTWVDSWTVYAVNGRYSEYVSGVLARQDDGIHLTFEGTRFLTRKVYALLRR